MERELFFCWLIAVQSSIMRRERAEPALAGTARIAIILGKLVEGSLVRWYVCGLRIYVSWEFCDGWLPMLLVCDLISHRKLTLRSYSHLLNSFDTLFLLAAAAAMCTLLYHPIHNDFTWWRWREKLKWLNNTAQETARTHILGAHYILNLQREEMLGGMGYAIASTMGRYRQWSAS